MKLSFAFTLTVTLLKKREKTAHILGLPSKSFASNFKHHCFFTATKELFLVHRTGIRLLNI